MVVLADRKLLTSLFDAAVSAADPVVALRPFLPDPPKGRTVVIGAGKGAAQMAAAIESLWDGPLMGTVVTRYGYATTCEHIEVREAAHPVPDPAGLAASSKLLDLVHGLTKDDLVIALICGGGSSLLPCPLPGLDLDDEIALNQELLRSGAPISVMNAIRKVFSGIKGGRLAAAASPARVVSLVVSDVPGDDPAEVASGPTVASASGVEDARRLVETYGIDLSPRLANFLTTAPDTLHPNAATLTHCTTHVVASARQSLEAAALQGKKVGFDVQILSDSIEGEAVDVGRVHGAIAREVARNGRPFERPVILLSGGETTVTITGDGGRGGRNSEFLLSLAREIDSHEVVALAADTDGIDGSESNAGAFADGTTWSRLLEAGHDPLSLLKRHDSWGAFDALGDLFAPGPTGTNVNDFRAILIR